MNKILRRSQPRANELGQEWFDRKGKAINVSWLESLIAGDLIQVLTPSGLMLVKIEKAYTPIIAFLRCCGRPVTNQGFVCRNCKMDGRAVTEPIRPSSGRVLANGKVVEFADDAWREQIQMWLSDLDVFAQIMAAEDLGRAVEFLLNLPLKKKPWYRRNRLREDIIVAKELQSGVRIIVF